MSYYYIVCVCVACTADEVLSVNGISMEVPNIGNTEMKVCVSFGFSTPSDRTIVLAHHINDPEKLSAYFLNATNCTTAPPAGDYIVGVFTQSVGITLEVPATPPTISILIVPISEY